MTRTIKSWYCKNCQTLNPKNQETCIECGLTPLKNFGVLTKVSKKQNNECQECDNSKFNERSEIECTLNLNDECPHSEISNKTNKESKNNA